MKPYIHIDPQDARAIAKRITEGARVTFEIHCNCGQCKKRVAFHVHAWTEFFRRLAAGIN